MVFKHGQSMPRMRFSHHASKNKITRVRGPSFARDSRFPLVTFL